MLWNEQFLGGASRRVGGATDDPRHERLEDVSEDVSPACARLRTLRPPQRVQEVQWVTPQTHFPKL